MPPSAGLELHGHHKIGACSHRMDKALLGRACLKEREDAQRRGGRNCLHIPATKKEDFRRIRSNTYGIAIYADPGMLYGISGSALDQRNPFSAFALTAAERLGPGENEEAVYP